MRLTNRTVKNGILPALFLFSCACSVQAQAPDNAFVALADAYLAGDAAAAAAAYAHDAEVIYAYDGSPESRIKGREAIRQSFADFFGRIDPTLKLDLNFRVAVRQGSTVNGYYRLRFGEAQTSYGRFDVELSDDGLFQRDRSSSATRSDFEEAAGPLLVRPDDNNLDRAYYSLFTGHYLLPDGCRLVVTRSIARLFVRNSCDQSWRGLDRVSGLEWTAGDTVLPDKVSSTYRFAAVTNEPSSSIAIRTGNSEVTALRRRPYTSEDVSFLSADSTRLAGTLYLPAGRSRPSAATVLVHGSGPQDRDGYASIIAVLADALAAEGRAVLAFDKRGSGASQGNGDGAGFDLLAADVRAAMSYLTTRQEVDAHQIGLAGSSQAGWVIAKAIEAGAMPADVFLLGAAGAAFTVPEQNLYNTDVRMACAGISGELRRIALDQQSAFFDAVTDRTKTERLDALTREGAKHPDVRDWLFPDSSGLDAKDAWFTVLDPAFDPLPVWQGYAGRAMFAFSEFDDSTDTDAAIARLRGIGSHVSTVAINDAQHLGLVARSLCDGELADRTNFSPALFAALAEFVAAGEKPTARKRGQPERAAQ